ncbi:MAG: pentapeptide repeat-containing protein, partial [Prochloraceae cyanobacterium]
NLERANLERVNLERANLGGANLGGANLGRANLGGANLEGANLGGADFTDAQHLTHKQIKSTCFWQNAIYNPEKSENQKYIEKLKTDKSSDPKELPACSIWSRFNNTYD